MVITSQFLTNITISGLAAGSSTLAVPWAELSLRTGDFVEPEYLPENFTLRDPSKLKKEEVTVLLTLWKERQKTLGHTQIFQFSHYLSGGRAKVLKEAKYPDILEVRSGPKRRRKGTQGRQSRARLPAIVEQRELTSPPALAPIRSHEARRTVQPAPNEYQPPAPSYPAPSYLATIPTHSYAGWPPPPIPDGTGPNDEIQLQATRQLVIQGRGETTGDKRYNLTPTLTLLCREYSILNPQLWITTSITCQCHPFILFQ